MDFSYSEEQRDIQNLARQIFADQCEPQRLKQLETQDADYDQALWRALIEAGLPGVANAEALGGMGFGFESLCIVLEEQGRHAAKVPLLPVMVGACLPLEWFASSEQKEQWLKPVLSGQSLITRARIEPGCENPLKPSMTAVKRGDHYDLQGSKQCVPLAADASHVMVAAQSDEGLLLAVVPTDAAGLTLTAQRVTSGERYYAIRFDQVQVSSEHILACGERAVECLQQAELYYQAALCAMAVGICDKMMRMTGSYTSEREQFGRPVATFQAVAHRMADAYKDVECLRLTTQQAISQLAQGRDAEEAVLVAKAWCGDVCHRVSQAAQHCHGGIGVDRDYPLFRYCLMAREIELTAGNSASLLDEIGNRIARQALNAG